jgi:hypothetical protein
MYYSLETIEMSTGNCQKYPLKIPNKNILNVLPIQVYLQYFLLFIY